MILSKVRAAATSSPLVLWVIFSSAPARATTWEPYYPAAGPSCAQDIGVDGNQNVFIIGCDAYSNGGQAILLSNSLTGVPWETFNGRATSIAIGGGQYAGNSLSVVNASGSSFFFSPDLNGFYEYPNSGFVYRMAATYPTYFQPVNTSAPAVYVSQTDGDLGPRGFSSEWALTGDYATHGYPVAFRQNPADGQSPSYWVETNGEAVAVAIGESNVPYVADDQGIVYYFDASASAWRTFAPWTANGGYAVELAVDSYKDAQNNTFDSIWVVNFEGALFHYASPAGVPGSFVHYLTPSTVGRVAAAFHKGAAPRQEYVVILSGQTGTGSKIYNATNCSSTTC